MLNMDKKLLKREEEGKVIRVGIVGAGQMGRGMVTQMVLMKGIHRQSYLISRSRMLYTRLNMLKFRTKKS